MRINEECMRRYLKSYRGITFEVKKLMYDKNTQDYTLAEGMPLISRINNAKLGIFNNEMFICHKINEKDIIVKNLSGEEYIIDKNYFNKYFLLQFCITTHKSQGISLDKPYCIYEINKFNKKLLYVALSRATKYEYINIIMNKEELIEYDKHLFANNMYGRLICKV